MAKFAAIAKDPKNIRIDQIEEDGTQHTVLLLVGSNKVMLSARAFPLADLPGYLEAVKSLVGSLQSLSLLD